MNRRSGRLEQWPQVVFIYSKSTIPTLMNRRYFLATGVSGIAGAIQVAKDLQTSPETRDDVRSEFPWLQNQIYLNAAGMMPTGSFSALGLEKYIEFQKLGPQAGRGEYVNKMRSEIRGMFASMIGAREEEVGLVHCTKAGEQVVIDALPSLSTGSNIVTNDMHFTGSLHNYVGLRNAGRDVRIVRSRKWKIDVDEFTSRIDDRTALVSVSLVSNINGHVEEIRKIADVAHDHGAIVYADIIQAAGIVPIDVNAMGIDAAACSCYKWLYGVHGTGFLYVRKSLQGQVLRDNLFPGHVRHNYAPWVGQPADGGGEFVVAFRDDATRYQPGHVSYLGYCAAYEGLKFISDYGIEKSLEHSTRLNRRLLGKVDLDRYTCITPDVRSVPIVTFTVDDRDEVQRRLEQANIAVSLAGNRMRVSPAVYNNDDDIDRLAEVLDY